MQQKWCDWIEFRKVLCFAIFLLKISAIIGKNNDGFRLAAVTGGGGLDGKRLFFSMEGHIIQVEKCGPSGGCEKEVQVYGIHG